MSSILTRDYLKSGAYLASFVDNPHIKWWSREQIEASMEATLAQRPNPQAPVWVFAYGSLIWNPAFLYAEKQRATLPGWRRSFCMRLLAGRATPEHPGRMLALEPVSGTVADLVNKATDDGVHPCEGDLPRPGEKRPAGSTPASVTGIAFRMDERTLHEELILVWMREMIGGTYQPCWQTARLADGRHVQTIVFAMDHGNHFYEPDASVATVVPLIANASGHIGPNIDYLLELEKALAAHDIHDPYVSDLIDAVRFYASDI